LAGAGHAEYGVPPEEALITPAACEVPKEGEPRIHGRQPVHLRPGTMTRSLYDADEVFEEFHCSNELNTRYQPLFESSQLRVSGVGDRGEARIVELEGARFYIATLFLPQLTAVDKPHPVVDGFVRAVAARSSSR
jgi:CTP synthase (UTP-ammonia lyase)